MERFGVDYAIISMLRGLRRITIARLPSLFLLLLIGYNSTMHEQQQLENTENWLFCFRVAGRRTLFRYTKMLPVR